MGAAEIVAAMRAAGASYQRPLNQVVDDFRRAPDSTLSALHLDPGLTDGPLEGLLAAVISALCRELGLPAPEWVSQIRSPEPFFAFPANGFALRLRLMIESPPPFRSRNVFVPESFLRRA